MQSKGLVGRQAELNLLTDWVAKPSEEVYAARILSIVAIGGMGKSALTWKWFNDIAPHEMKPLAGRMLWSFYESDVSLANRYGVEVQRNVTLSPKQNNNSPTTGCERRYKGQRKYLQIVDRRTVPRLGHNQAIGAIAHRQCRLIWLILHQGVRYEERGPAVTKQSRQVRTARMICQLRKLGYRVELANSQPTNSQGR